MDQNRTFLLAAQASWNFVRKNKKADGLGEDEKRLLRKAPLLESLTTNTVHISRM
jgi:hypothetical protein